MFNIVYALCKISFCTNTFWIYIDLDILQGQGAEFSNDLQEILYYE